MIPHEGYVERDGRVGLDLDCLTVAQWEALCDGCGRGCLHKPQDGDTEMVVTTMMACRHPLVSGDPASVHRAGIAVRDFAPPEIRWASPRLAATAGRSG